MHFFGTEINARNLISFTSKVAGLGPDNPANTKQKTENEDDENKTSEAFQVTLDILHPLFLNSASYLNVDEHTLRADAENLKHVQQDLDGKLFPLRCQVIVDTCAHLQHSAPFVSCVSVNEVHHLVLLTRALRSILTLQLPGERRVSRSTGESVL